MRHLALRWSLSGLLALALAAPGFAQGTRGEPDPLRFGDEKTFVEFAPFFQLDAAYGDSDPARFFDGLDNVDGAMRRARLYTDFGLGRLGGEFTVDFATDNGPDIIYAYLDYALTENLDLTVGQQNGIFSLQDATSSRPALFNEDGQNETLQPEDTVGASLRYGTETTSLAAGVFGADVNRGAFEDGWTLMGRATTAPIARNDLTLHLGLGLIGRFDLEKPLSFSGTTGVDVFDVSTIATGDYEDVESYFAANPEAALIAGRLTLAAEYTLGRVTDRVRPDADVHGGYLSALVFLTDDTRPYDGSTGTFERVEPKAPVGEGGFGAVEVGARFDALDLSDAGPEAGAELAEEPVQA